MKTSIAVIAFLALSFTALAEEDMDVQITKKLEFYSQMDVVQNLEVVQNYETLVAEAK